MQTLWQAHTSMPLMMAEKDGGAYEGALRFARMHIEHFVESYDSGDMDVEDWEELARVMREVIDREGLLDGEQKSQD